MPSESTPPPRLVALEFVVDDLGPALELFADHLGFPLVDRSPHPALDADLYVFDADPVAITVLHRTSVGDRPQVPPVLCNLSQLIFDVDGHEQLARLHHRFEEAGAGVVEDGPAMFHLARQLSTATFGVAPAFVFHTVGDEPADPTA